MKKLLSVVLLLMIGVCGVQAQDQTGMIYGNVTNEDGAVLSGAKIIAESPSLIRPFETVTNARGRYVLPVLPVGTYRITVTAENYQGTALEDISISVNNRLRIDIVLKTGVVGEDVVVITGDAPLVDVSKTDTGMNISKELFDKLPKGRNFQSIVALAPGASDEGDQFGGIMIDGASSSENVFVIDGAGTNDLIGGRNAQNAVFEFVEEVQVRSGGYQAEYGGSMGGVVNVVTRSGGNEFSGSLIGYYQADWLNSDTRDTLRINPFDGTNNTAEYFKNDKDDYYRLDIGGSLGGYVLKDKVWFFASYLPWFDSQERTVDFRDSDGSVYETRTYTQDEVQHNAAAKISMQITDKWNFSVSGSTDWYKWEGQLPSRQGTSNPDASDPEFGYKFPGYVASARTDYFVNDDLYFSGTWGYHQVNTELVKEFEMPNDARRRFIYSPRDEWNAMMPAEYRHSAGYSNLSWEEINSFNEDLVEQMSTTTALSYFLDLAGDHQWKTGFQTFWVHNRASDGNVAQYYFFYWDQEYHAVTPAGQDGRGQYGFYRMLSYEDYYGLNGEASSYRYAIFLQDTWSPNDRLTINAGIRAESEKLPSYDDNFPDPLDFGFGDKLAPRIGVSYDVFGDGTLKAYGNFGVYYDVMKLEMARQGYGGLIWRDGWYTLDSLEWWNPSVFPNTVDPSAYSGNLLEVVNWRIPAVDTTDPETEPMGIFEYIAGFDWQFADNQAVNVRFVHKTLRRAIEDVGIITNEGEVYWHGNPGFGATKRILEESGYPSVEAIRDYYGMDIRYLKRFSNNWTGGVNLTFAKLKGNYAGLTNTDEDDRDSPNVNRNFDLWWQTFDANWNQNIDILQSDRRYTTTIFGSYLFDEGMLNGLVIGFQQIINDGTPFTTEVDLNGIDGYFPFGRGDQGRHDIITQTDLYAEYNLRISDAYTLNLNMNVTNLFDQDGELSRHRLLNRGNVSFSDAYMLNSYNSGGSLPILDTINSGNGTDNRFGMTNRFQGPRSIRLGAKLTF